MRIQLHRVFRATGGFNDNEWVLFQEDLRSSLRDEDNRIGLEGRRLHGITWDNWLDALMDSGLGNYYWGPEANRKWKFPKDKDKIRPYMRQVVQRAAGYVRESKRVELRRLKISSKADHMHNDTSPDSSEQATSHSEANQQKRLRTILPRSSASNHKRIFDKTLDPITPPPAKRAQTSFDHEESGHNHDSIPSVVKAKSASIAITNTPNIGALHEQLGSTHEGNLTRFTEDTALPTISAESQVFEPTHEANLATSVEKPMPVVQQNFEFALETSVAGSIDIMLIHGPDVPTTAHFAKIFCQKHRLGPEYEVQGIRVERLGLDNKLIHVDLTDERDWNHILRVLMLHSLRVEVLIVGP